MAENGKFRVQIGQFLIDGNMLLDYAPAECQYQ